MRPIDADALVAGLEESYKELRKLYDSIKDDAGAKDVYQGELITFLEAILRTRNAPTIDCEPVRHGEWVHAEPDGFEGQKPFVCSECGLRHPRFGNTNQMYFRFCPWCGIEMKAWLEEDS